jgi:tripeptide aminopeptidase
VTNLPTIDEKAAVERVTRLMAIPGKSCEEGKVVAFITEQLGRAGISQSALTTDSANKKSPRGGETGNLILKLPGTVKGPRRLLMAHIDTVPLCVGAEPVRKGDLIASKSPRTALGGDDRAGASVALTAILEIQKQNLPHPPLTVLWCVQEEIGLYGARFVGTSKLGGPKLCFNWDGSAPEAISIGATGDYAIEIEVQGIASHAGAHPEEGVSAITVAAVAIADLQANGWLGKIEKGKKTGTANVGVVAGGDATNVVTPLALLKAEARSHDPEFRKKIVAEIEKAFTRAAKQVKSAAGKTGRIEFTSELKYEAFALKTSEPVVQSAMAAVRAVGLEPNPVIVNGGLDANWMANHGFPTVTLGCGQQAIHTVEETLHVPSYLRACQIGLVLATGAA